MKITKRQLKRIIKEEKAQLLSEAATGMRPGPDGIVVVDREGLGNPKDRWLVLFEVEDLVSPELYAYLSRRSDWRNLLRGPKATGPTEEAARAKLDKAIHKFLAELEKKIDEAENHVRMLDQFHTSIAGL